MKIKDKREKYCKFDLVHEGETFCMMELYV